ncbi:MAG: hypothetical protein HZR80_06845 [Candidatus Heimdallarchaeota archaeon]
MSLELDVSIKIKNSSDSTLNLFHINNLNRTRAVSEKTIAKGSHLYDTKPADLSRRTLIIVPGYSVSNPPRIGDHRYYIEALEYHPQKNPFGYKKIFVFDLYSEKDGRCNFKHDIPMLAEELMENINTKRNGWNFHNDGEIDFIAGSMGGLIVRKFIQEYLIYEDQIHTTNSCLLRVKNIILIATPNNGCKIVDRLQSPFLQFLLKLFFGKDNFSQSKQFQQIRIGNINVFGRLLGLFFKKKSPKNNFLRTLNSNPQTPGNIRWVTIRGTKSKWFSKLLHKRGVGNDGVVSSSSIPLIGAENIADKDFNMNFSWNHRDLYQDAIFCKILAGMLLFNLKLRDFHQYSRINNLIPKTMKKLPLNKKILETYNYFPELSP